MAKQKHEVHTVLIQWHACSFVLPPPWAAPCNVSISAGRWECGAHVHITHYIVYTHIRELRAAVQR